MNPLYRPRPQGKSYVESGWKVSQRVFELVKAVAQYAEVEPYQLVDEFLGKNLADLAFVEWLENQRYHKRIEDKIFPQGLEEAKREIAERIRKEAEEAIREAKALSAAAGDQS